MPATQQFKSPSVTHQDNGLPRRVGFELEFYGLTLEQTIAALQSTLGGEASTLSAAEKTLYVDSLGTFHIGLDWDFLKRKASTQKRLHKNTDWVELLSQAATNSLLVPMEVACPPIPLTQLEALTPVLTALREAGAVGTDDSPLAAYGVHVNIDIPRLDAATLFLYLKAFALLQWWLAEALEVDMTRKISPFIYLYPEPYIKQLLMQQNPSMEQIVSDYLEYNPSRNRALDMLPILAQIDKKSVMQRVQDIKIKARPAFHYRLPNCEIERRDWSLATAWNSWWVVEQLTQLPQQLDELGTAFLQAERPFLGVNRKSWVEFIDKWLKNHELA